MILNAWIIL